VPLRAPAISERGDIRPYDDLAAQFRARILKRSKVGEAAGLLATHKIRRLGTVSVGANRNKTPGKGMWQSATRDMVEDILASVEFSAEFGNIKNQIGLA
jgi:hypothetical protein